MDRDADQARRSLQSVEETGRETSSELRRLLGILRTQPGGNELEPQPGLGRLDELVATARAAGVDVTACMDPELPRLPASIDLAAYRVVQEGLTNVMKHARQDRVDVAVRFDADQLKIMVINSGRLAYQEALHQRGNGLSGLQERVQLLGGTLRAGPTATGSFELDATFPLCEQP